MLRLSAVLLAAIYAAMVIWGEPAGTGVTVTRVDAPPSVPGLSAAPQPAPAASGTAAEGIAGLSAAEAVRVALASGEGGVEGATTPGPMAPPPQQADADGDVRYVTGARVNLRTGPSTAYAVIGTASRGDRAELLSDPAEPWTRIRTERGLEAWISSGFLSETPA